MDTKAEEEVANTVQNWLAAERTADEPTLSRLLDDRFIGIGPLGFILTKEDWLQRHQSKELIYNSLEISESSIRMFDGCAIVISHQTQDAAVKGQQVKAELRISLTLIDHAGNWRIAGLQMSPIGQPLQFANQAPIKPQS